MVGGGVGHAHLQHVALILVRQEVGACEREIVAVSRMVDIYVIAAYWKG